jgi:hypothetical protein
MLEFAFQKDQHACFRRILQHRRYSLTRVRPFVPRQMEAPHGARLADRSLPRLFRGYVDCLPRLASAVGSRRQPS